MRIARFAAIIAWSVVAVLLGLVPALAEKRVALVIGNTNYRHAPELKNPGHDATDIAATLKGLGFIVVGDRAHLDLDKASMDRAVRDFAETMVGADVGLFFYSGHGLQIAGVNYLVPVDARLTTASALDFEMLRLDLVQKQMEREANSNVLFLDACRNNPLARNLARAMGTRSTEIGRGLANVSAGVGTLISFATQPDNVAQDGTGRNSPFTTSLLKHMAAAEQDLTGILISVRNDVRTVTAGRQVPWENSALTGRFYFAGAPAASITGNVPQSADPAAQAWAVIQNTTSIAVLETYISQFGSTVYGGYARARVEELKKSQVAVVAPVQPPTLVQPTVGVFPPASGVAPLSPERERALKPKDSFKECDQCPEMVVVPSGSFSMGSPASEVGRYDDEGPQHQVTISRSFAVGKFAVTVDLFAAFVTDTGYNAGSECYVWQNEKWEKQSGRSWRDPGFSQGGNHPAVCISWDDAKAYVAWLSRKTGRTYRLLSESEREYVTRAGTTTPFWWGSSISTGQANYNGNYIYNNGSKGEYRQRTMPVDSFQPNPWGFYQVHGNVLDWTEDCWNDNYNGAPTDGSARTSGDCSRRVLRGGSWNGYPQNLRSAYRGRGTTVDRGSTFGFRLGRTLSITP
jgi:formylglycine-generating enzyme required for sulfatase activity